MTTISIPVYKPFLGGNVRAYVDDCIDSTWVSSRGKYVDEFEKSFGAYVGTEHATSVFNGTVALHLALVALGINPGDEVIVPTFTYVASVNTILQVGAVPVFVDSLADTLQVDPSAVKAAINERTRAIMAVHLYGHPCDMQALSDLATQHGLYVIEDAAEGFGSRISGQHVGTFSDVATFSFFGNKTITTGEGGMILAKDPEIIDRCRHLKSQGVSKQREYWHDSLAFNYRMTNIQAAIGLAQLEMAEDILARKRSVAAHYSSALQGLPLRFHNPVGPVDHSYWMCSIILEDPADRTALRQHLAENGIETRPFFPLTHTMPHCAGYAEAPIAAKLSASGINLPSFPGLTIEELEVVTESIRRFFGK